MYPQPDSPTSRLMIIAGIIILVALSIGPARRAWIRGQAGATFEMFREVEKAIQSFKSGNMMDGSNHSPTFADLAEEDIKNPKLKRELKEGHPKDAFGEEFSLPEGSESPKLSPKTYQKIRELVPVPEEYIPKGA